MITVMACQIFEYIKVNRRIFFQFYGLSYISDQILSQQKFHQLLSKVTVALNKKIRRMNGQRDRVR